MTSILDRRQFAGCAWSVPASMLFLAAFLLVSVIPAYSASDFIPSQIEGLEMGIPASAVMEKIKGTGSTHREELPKQQRLQWVWTPPDNPFYETITFVFTEKDRLYMIRYTLKDSRRDALKVRKGFFEHFGVDDDSPMRFTMRSNDVLVYGPGKSTDFVFEHTDTRTGQKSFEIFRREISAEDRPPLPAGAAPDGSKSPEGAKKAPGESPPGGAPQPPAKEEGPSKTEKKPDA